MDDRKTNLLFKGMNKNYLHDRIFEVVGAATFPGGNKITQVATGKHH